jgi:4-alpha-glucanotransferase
MTRHRGSGILLHITSLPSPYGIGDMGPEAYRFVDYLSEGLQSYWQVLPLGITDPAFGNTPYDSISAFAGNPLLISPALLIVDKLLLEEETEPIPPFKADRIDYPLVMSYKNRLLDKAYEHFLSKGKDGDYERFCSANAYWLDDFVLFRSIKIQQEGRPWSGWPEELRDREKDAMQKARDGLKNRIDRERFCQYVFFKQWYALKGSCNDRGIKIIGDIPIYVNYDSADVWANPGLFKLDKDHRQIVSAGVPPDYFSPTGQLWGNPIYNWNEIQKSGYAWWILRLGHSLRLFDVLRIDHLRGLVSYWEVPAGEKTAVNGRWIEAPAEEFFTKIFRHFSCISILAEDLGTITPDVREIMNRFDIPGMKVLLFGFGDDLSKNPYVPHNHIKNCVIYTGTHDNNTVKGWFEHEAKPEDRLRFSSYLGHEPSKENVSWEMIRMAMMSVADTAILPMQDILGLGEEARMNHPGTTKGNYLWRMLPEQMNPKEDLKEMTRIYGRA